jgi:HD-GYP domain-containing protein (c-di-GMP phosphodiesterase class II)
VKRRIRLRGINGEVENKTWESDSLLRAGRLATLELVIEDSSVSRRHAEVRSTGSGWRVRDLGSTNGTFLNGNRIGPGEWPVRVQDIIRFGNVTVVVDQLKESREDDDTHLFDHLLVEASEVKSWDDAVSGLAFDRNQCPRPGEQMLALLRAGHHLVNLESEEDLLHTILNDAVSTLDSQRGAIVLAETPTGPLKLRALANGQNQIGARQGFSQSLAQRCFNRGESILCCQVDEDPELAGARSIAEGTMASVLCVLLRTPRKRLGVLHLDRGPMQQPFTKDDLHLADAMAAHVSAGIEMAQLLKKQRDLFYATVTMLAQAVEMRDEYTGGHTARVTEYAFLLGQKMDLPQEDLHLIRIGTPLHDIGKIGIDDAILRKPGKLTAAEFEIMKTHTLKGVKMIEQVAELAPILPIIRSHHERWDGMGYPDGTKGTATNKLARLVAVADAFDAMTFDRPYRKGMPADVAFAEVEKQRGKQFDPEAANAFLLIKPQIVQQMQSESRRTCSVTPDGTLRLAQ